MLKVTKREFIHRNVTNTILSADKHIRVNKERLHCTNCEAV